MKKKQSKTALPPCSPQTVLAQIYTALLLSTGILYIGPNGYEDIHLVKRTVFLVLGGGYVLLSALLSVQMVLIGEAPRPQLRRRLRHSTPTACLIVLYLLLTLAASLISPYQETWLGMSRGEGFLTICIYVLTFLLLHAYGSFRPWMIHVLGASITVNSLVAILQLLGHNPLSLYPQGLTYFDAGVRYNGEYLGLTGNADVTSALLTLAVPLFFVYLWKGREKSRIWLIIPLLLSVSVLLWCKVAAGYVALLAGTVLTIPALLPQKRQRTAAWCTAGVLILAALLAVYFWSPPGGTLRELHLLLHGQADSSFGSGRLHIWKQVLELASDHLWFGTGPDTLLAANLEGFRRYDHELNTLLMARIDLAHNEYLNILVSQGLPALLSYLCALGGTTIKWLKHAHKNPLLAACGAAMIWYSIHVFFSFSLCAAAPLFWVVWASAEQSCKTEDTKV